MNNNTNGKITKEKIAGAAGLTMTLMATSIGSAMHNSSLGLSLMTIGLAGTGVILGYSLGFKAGRRTAFKEALA